MRSAEKLEQIRVLLTAINHQLSETLPAKRSMDRPTGAGSESPSQANIEPSADVSVEEVESLTDDLFEAATMNAEHPAGVE